MQWNVIVDVDAFNGIGYNSSVGSCVCVCVC